MPLFVKGLGFLLIASSAAVFDTLSQTEVA